MGVLLLVERFNPIIGLILIASDDIIAKTDFNFNPIIGLILMSLQNSSLVPLSNFNPIIGLILIMTLAEKVGGALAFQSHYRSDFNFR